MFCWSTSSFKKKPWIHQACLQVKEAVSLALCSRRVTSTNYLKFSLLPTLQRLMQHFLFHVTNESHTFFLKHDHIQVGKFIALQCPWWLKLLLCLKWWPMVTSKHFRFLDCEVIVLWLGNHALVLQHIYASRLQIWEWHRWSNLCQLLYGFK